MSTDLYGIRVLEVDPTHARLRLCVFVVYYDVSHNSHQPLPYDRSFFMRVLCDKGALDDEVTTNEYLDESFVNRNAFRYVERFETLEIRNEPVTSYEGFLDFYYERDGEWSDEGSLVQGDYDVFVTNADFLAAFSVGDSWGTTSYTTDSDGLSLDDCARLPGLDDAILMLSPFLDQSGEGTNITHMAFSPDGSMLACTNEEAILRVFSIPQGEQLLEVKDVASWCGGLGWALDGCVVMGFEHWDSDASKSGYHKVDLTTGDVTFTSAAGYPAHPSGTRFFHNPMNTGNVCIKDAHGEVFYEHAHEEDYTAFVSFDVSGDFALLALEQNGLFFVDVLAGTSVPIKAPSLQELTFNHIGMSPDARTIIAEIQDTSKGAQLVDRVTGEVLRTQPWSGYLIASTWSMDNRFVAMAYCTTSGYDTRLYVYCLDQEVEASFEDTPSSPTPKQMDTAEGLEALAQLFVEKTAGFDPRQWETHLDDTLSTFHLTLMRCGSSLDLIPHMNDKARQIDTRARESIVAESMGDTSRAERALQDAHARLKAIGTLQRWSYPRAYAMLSAADHLQGHNKRAQHSFEALQAFFANYGPHNHVHMLIHAALLMGKEDLVRELILKQPHDSFAQSGKLILKVLSNEGRMDLFTLAVDHWSDFFNEDWGALGVVQKILCHAGEFERSYNLEGFALTPTKFNDRDLWLKWFAANPDAAISQLSMALAGEDLSSVGTAKVFEFFVRPDEVMAREGFDMGDMYIDSLAVAGLLRSSNPQAGIALLIDKGEYEHTTMLDELAMIGAFEFVQSTPCEPVPPELLPYFLAMRGETRSLCAHLDTLKRTQRSALYASLAQIAWLRKDTAVTLEFIEKMRFGDMGAPGIRSIQKAFAHLAGSAYRNMNN